MGNNDWRLTNQLSYLGNKDLTHTHYKKYSNSWGHDHCEFCFTIFENKEQPGYCTLDYYHWICETCFDDFKEIFNWKV